MEGGAVVPSNGDDPLTRVRVVWNTVDRETANSYMYIPFQYPDVHMYTIKAIYAVVCTYAHMNGICMFAENQPLLMYSP